MAHLERWRRRISLILPLLQWVRVTLVRFRPDLPEKVLLTQPDCFRTLLRGLLNAKAAAFYHIEANRLADDREARGNLVGEH
eukprot:1927871-Prymnesium_polylepis.1